MNQPLDFQTMILNLQDFWARYGCLIWQPYYTQVGAGTMNPATFLRVLGPEPWNVAYVEPSVRPDDGRYGENPNRLVQHTQFQVILKPDPGNPQEVYLQSLQALGIDPARHDIRFVEDNWESPALGAWGLGWEVWLDGQEITQFTYFQQAGGLPLDPVSVEITYGLERIAMAMQGIRHFRDLRWNGRLTCGDVLLQGEQEHSRYYFEVADVDRLQQMYNLFEAEAEASLKAGLVLPAHDYVLKCSHTFNILDTRGVIGVTERQAFFARMRDLARRLAETYLEQRLALGYPFLPVGGEGAGSTSAAPPEPVSSPSDLSTAADPADFMLEIGTEELPPADLQSALSQLNESVPAMLEGLRLAHGSVRILGTPRRLAVLVDGLSARQPDREFLVKGPPASRAFDPEGKPTPAAEGFARSRGLALGDLQVMEIDGGQYAAARISELGRPAVQVLSEALPGLLAGIRFDKSMRWNASNVAFSRPVRWLLALFGSQPVPFEYAGLRAGCSSRGLRFGDTPETTIETPSAYDAFLRAQGILLDPEERRFTITDQVQVLLKKAGADPSIDGVLLNEVSNLVEAPTAFIGSFDPQHLDLPQDVLVSVMKKHQRYFPVYKPGGGLLPHFIGVRNGGSQQLETVADGNAQVIVARFADAAFFIREDLKQNLEDFLPRLGTLTFQFKLGSMLDKSRRIEALVERLAPAVGLQDADLPHLRRTAALCKADLVSHMVVEMTSLQGIMGRYYATHSGEPKPVAEAIYEHYLPRFPGDGAPAGRIGLAVGIADRLDSLSGLFAAGLAPTAAKDPFGQRRTALGLVAALSAWDLDFDLRSGLGLAAALQPLSSTPEVEQAILEFIAGRLRGVLLEEGFRYDVVEAVLAAQQHNPAGARRAARALTARVEDPAWAEIQPAHARCVRILRTAPGEYACDPARLVEESEKALYADLLKAEQKVRKPGSVDDFFAAFTPLVPAINHFFDTVLVMTEDPSLRDNRLGLLQRITALDHGVADLSLLEGF